ncbi:MAG: c-type cytochrome [Leptothrix sp. (in: b-proteobacteria)]
MNSVVRSSLTLVVAGAALYFGSATTALAVDADAARALAKSNDCFKCHAIDKTKKGPSYKKIAEKYKGKADAEAKLIKHLTTSPKVKFEDGSEEDHKEINTKDLNEIKNLIGWILSQ